MAGGPSEAAITDALRGVIDPELHKDLVTLGMAKNVQVHDGQVSLLVTLTTPACPLRETIEKDVRAALAKVPGVTSVDLKFDAAVPPGIRPQGKAPIEGVKNLIAVASGKGGVGKSTVAVNMAVALARCGASVGLLDADFYGPSIPIMTGLIDAHPHSRDGKTMEPLLVHGLKIMSIGFLVEPDQALVWRGPMLHGALIQLLRDVSWGELDYLILDLPPGTGDIPLTLSQQIRAAGVVLVTTPQDVSLSDVLKAKLMFDKVHIPILGLVENMSSFACPHCGESTAIFDSGGGEKAAAQMRIPFLGSVPIDVAIREGGDQGVPIVAGKPDSPQALALVQLAKRVAGQVSSRSEGMKLPIFKTGS
jgi:ATP-binding protein involved in chromosome partitioning